MWHKNVDTRRIYDNLIKIGSLFQMLTCTILWKNRESERRPADSSPLCPRSAIAKVRYSQGPLCPRSAMPKVPYSQKGPL